MTEERNGSRGSRDAGAAVVAAGARRASGERARRRRRTTPLLADLDPLPQVPAPAPGGSGPVPPTESTPPAAPASPTARPTRAAVKRAATKGTAVKRTATKETATKGTAKAPARSTPKPATKRTAKRAPEQTPKQPPGSASTPAAKRSSRPAGASRSAPRRPASRQTAGGERLVAVADLGRRAGEQIVEAVEESRAAPATGSGAAGQDAARAAGGETHGLDGRIAEILGFLRRRLTGDYVIDEFGFDPELTETVTFSLLRVLYRRWFRVEVRGIDNVPSTGGALVVANHAGAIALDAMMMQVAMHDEHPRRRFLRPLGADLVFAAPLLGELSRKGGATLATNADAERLLSAGEVVGVWPEGFKGIGKPFSERYKLQRFGRGGFVSAALRTQTPIVPCAIVGSEETYPILGNMPTLARLLGLPYVPITPTFPLLGLLGAIPLPSKWLIEFGAPVSTDVLGPGAADDPMLVFDLTDQVRQTIQQTLYQLLVQRQSVFL